MTTIVNRRAGTCVTCGMYVPPQAGTATRVDGAWRVFCADHPAAEAPQARTALAALLQQRADDGWAPAAELRITGNLAECAALVDAVRLATGIRILHVSEPQPRRDDDPRASVYVRVHVDPRLLAAMQREEEQQ